jgi:hypothetical protein
MKLYEASVRFRNVVIAFSLPGAVANYTDQLRRLKSSPREALFLSSINGGKMHDVGLIYHSSMLAGLAAQHVQVPVELSGFLVRDRPDGSNGIRSLWPQC